MAFFSEFLYSPSSEWLNLQAGDNFTFPSTPNHNSVNDSCFNNVSACILCANCGNFNEASPGLLETGNNVADINNLVNPSAHLASTTDAYDNLVDASTCLNSTSTKVNVNISNIININKYSSLSKLLHIICWVMKAKATFLGKINKNKKESVTEEMIKGVDLSMANKMWLQEVQKDLQRIKNFKNMSCQLDLFEDDYGLWRCGGRLAKSNLPYSVIYLYFIPKEHYFATLIVLKRRDNVKRSGVRDTINNLCKEFWIPKSRNFVKGIINKCSVCRKFEGPCYDYQILELISIFHIRLLVSIMQVQSMLKTLTILQYQR